LKKAIIDHNKKEEGEEDTGSLRKKLLGSMYEVDSGTKRSFTLTNDSSSMAFIAFLKPEFLGTKIDPH